MACREASCPRLASRFIFATDKHLLPRINTDEHRWYRYGNDNGNGFFLETTKPTAKTLATACPERAERVEGMNTDRTDVETANVNGFFFYHGKHGKHGRVSRNGDNGMFNHG